MKLEKTILGLTFLLWSSTSLHAAGPGQSNDFKGKRVLLIGISGLRPDALQAADTPAIDALIAKGVITHHAQAGGTVGTATMQPTLSGPGFCSMLTGVWADHHLTKDDQFTGYDKFVSKEYPTFFKRLKTSVPNCSLTSITSWEPLEENLIAKSEASLDYHRTGVGASATERDQDVANRAVSQLGSENPDVLFLQFSETDHVGQSSGYSPSNAAYLKAIATIDSHVANVVKAIKKRPKISEEKWMILLTSDHGGTATRTRGGHSQEERSVSMMISGDLVKFPHVSTDSPPITAVPPTVLAYLGVPTKDIWNWHGPTFGMPPYFTSTVSKTNVKLEWKLPAEGMPGLTGFEVLRDGKSVAKLGTTSTSHSDTPGSGDHRYELRFLGTSQVRTSTASLLGDIHEKLVLHLPFNQNTQDASGRGNHGTLSGTPAAVAGKNGKCLQFTDTESPHQYLDLGKPSDLQFGPADSFTVSVWVNHAGDFANNKATGGSNDDPTILSNKDWSNGLNCGWVIGAGPNARWQWNIGDGKNRADYDSPANQLSDGQWHHLCVVHDRTRQEARLFYDGTLVATRSISAVGTLQSGASTAVGTDGNLGTKWPTWFSGKIDEVKIWRRALQNEEVKTVFQQ